MCYAYNSDKISFYTADEIFLVINLNKCAVSSQNSILS